MKCENNTPPPVFTVSVEVTPNPEVPGSERHAQRAREAIDTALTAAGYPSHPPRRLRVIRGEGVGA